MNLNGNELIEFFEGVYSQEEELNKSKKGLKDDMKSFAESNSIGIKALTSAYSLFKKYRSGSNTEYECDEYTQLSNIISDHFSLGD